QPAGFPSERASSPAWCVAVRASHWTASAIAHLEISAVSESAVHARGCGVVSPWARGVVRTVLAVPIRPGRARLRGLVRTLRHHLADRAFVDRERACRQRRRDEAR